MPEYQNFGQDGVIKPRFIPIGRYLLGRSSKSCDIVVRNPVVCRFTCRCRGLWSRGQTRFILKDENSPIASIANRKRRITESCATGDIFTWSPELAASVRLQYVDPLCAYLCRKLSAYGIEVLLPCGGIARG